MNPLTLADINQSLYKKIILIPGMGQCAIAAISKDPDIADNPEDPLANIKVILAFIKKNEDGTTKRELIEVTPLFLTESNALIIDHINQLKSNLDELSNLLDNAIIADSFKYLPADAVQNP